MAVFGAELEQRMVLYPRPNDIAVNFIGNDPLIPCFAEGDDGFQLLLRPNPSGRVVRAAKDHPFDGGIVQFGCKIVEIHRVIAVAADQRILNHPAAVARNFSGEGAIDRVLDDDAIPLVREDADQSAERRDNSGREKDFAGVNLPAEPPEKPSR